MATIDAVLLEQAINADLIRVQKHPRADLYIYNYTEKVQYERIWNELTLMCRGLILDAAGNIIARPLPKFFNLGEAADEQLPDLPFEVYEKMDGSLGILYWNGDNPCIATRGSFTSKQALVATKILHDRLQGNSQILDRSKTYVFEIIYPENRIIVDYGTEKELYLLAVVNTETGVEASDLTDYALLPFPLVRSYDGINDIHALKKLGLTNKEGFVVRFTNGYRVKVKFEEYLRLHRIITEISNLEIWDHLRNKKGLEHLLEKVPDEFYQWVKTTVETLHYAYQEIEEQAKKDFKILSSRKETAAYYYTCQYPGVLFKMMDNKNYESLIWRMIRPDFEKPFAQNMEE